MSLFNDPEKARDFLETAGVFYDTRADCVEWNKEYPEGHDWHHDEEEIEHLSTTLNMNDTFGWALAYGETVPMEKMCEVADLFWHYGFHGLTYWCAEREEWERSEFEDITRGIEFVRHEEKLRKEIESSSERAYKKCKYTLGGTSFKWRLREIDLWFFYKKIAIKRFFRGLFKNE